MPCMCLKIIMLPSYNDRVAAGMREAHTKGWWHEGRTARPVCQLT